MRKFFGSRGSISRITIESQALKNNMLDDPWVRAVDVYVPAGHDGQGLPLLWILSASQDLKRAVSRLWLLIICVFTHAPSQRRRPSQFFLRSSVWYQNPTLRNPFIDGLTLRTAGK